MPKYKQTTSLTNIKRIGVYIGVPGLGDLLFIIPLFRALKERFPEAETVFIGKLLRGYVRPIFDACQYIDSLMEFHLYEKKSFGSLLGFSARLRREKFDLIVDTQRKFAPSLLMKMGGPRFMVSYSSKGMFSDFEVPDSGDRSLRHTADVSLDLARALGIEPKLELCLDVPEQYQAYAAAFFGAAGIGEMVDAA